MYLIKDIKHKSTNETRTDGRYPLRIGSTIELNTHPRPGNPACFDYIKDNEGNPKEGTLRTSVVYSVLYDKNEVIITTRNSIFILEDLNKHWDKTCEWVKEIYGTDL